VPVPLRSSTPVLPHLLGSQINPSMLWLIFLSIGRISINCDMQRGSD
jgi:hypothetical protein